MLAERTVRRLSIRAPADALARRAGFLIEDALRTASLPGDGAELLLLRRVRLPPFAPGVSPQQVALHLEAVCRAAIAVDGSLVDDAALGAAPAVRFADALTAHLALTRLLLADTARQAWCWPLVVTNYRPTLGRAAALRALALSLAELPEAPAALPRWMALLLANSDAACAALVLALRSDDVARLQLACKGARRQAPPSAPAHWQSLLDWSAGQLGGDDGRHRWLLDMAVLCGVAVDHHIRRERGGADHGEDKALATRRVARHTGGDGGDKKRCAADAFDAALAAQQAALGALPAALPAATPAASSVPKSPHAADMGAPPRHLAAPPQAAAAASDGPPAPVAENVPGAGKAVASSEPSAAQSPATAPEAGRELTAPPVALAKDSPSTVDKREALLSSDAATAAGGLLLLVPLLNRLGLADFLGDDSAPSALPQRIFATLLRRLAIADADPLWLLCVLPLAVDREADGEAVRWLGHCRRHLRRHVGIGLYSLVCRPARIAITATHVDVRQDLNAVDLRIRRAGLDVDPGWVPWLGRVLRFHYGRDQG
jgi:hypothetical protein